LNELHGCFESQSAREDISQSPFCHSSQTNRALHTRTLIRIQHRGVIKSLNAAESIDITLFSAATVYIAIDCHYII
jgi:hypothetical protein